MSGLWRWQRFQQWSREPMLKRASAVDAYLTVLTWALTMGLVALAVAAVAVEILHR